MLAADMGEVDIVATLLSAGAEVFAKDKVSLSFRGFFGKNRS